MAITALVKLLILDYCPETKLTIHMKSKLKGTKIIDLTQVSTIDQLNAADVQPEGGTADHRHHLQQIIVIIFRDHLDQHGRADHRRCGCLVLLEADFRKWESIGAAWGGVEANAVLARELPRAWGQQIIIAVFDQIENGDSRSSSQFLTSAWGQ